MNFTSDFRAFRRDYQHWDIYVDQKRVYTIRGEMNSFSVCNEETGQVNKFRSALAGMAFICDILMDELP